MLASPRSDTPVRRHRRHGARLEPSERRALERAGWRTTLEFREDHVRARDGRLVDVRVSWLAEAEHVSDRYPVLRVVASSPEAAWSALALAATHPDQRERTGRRGPVPSH